MKIQTGIKESLLRLGAFFLLLVLFFCGPSLRTHALGSTFVVNSKADGVDASIGNGICQTATPGQCTLRAAIQEANATPGADTIHFAITGSSDFSYNTKSGYTITPTTSLPQITEALTIDGFSQDGAAANTTTYPYPFDTHLLIQIMDSSLNAGVTNIFQISASNVTIKGLDIARYAENDVANIIEIVNSQNVKIQGNYFGTDPTGMFANVTSYFFNLHQVNAISATDSSQITVGGSSPGDRNIFASIPSGVSFTTSDPSQGYLTHDITINGNYFGVGADGVTHPGARSEASILLDHVMNASIGGAAAGIGNMIENGYLDGVVVQNDSTNFQIQSNRIVGNTGNGIRIDHSSGGVIGGDSVSGGSNLISGNGSNGVLINQSSELAVEGNYIGVDQSGNLPLANTQNGIDAQQSSQLAISENVLSDNQLSAVHFENTSFSALHANIIGTGINGSTSLPNGASNAAAVLLDTGSANNVIGGEGQDESNSITNNNGAAVAVTGSNSVNNAILANRISNNGGLGIDLGFDGVTYNDSGDTDTGPNGLLNFPELNNILESPQKTLIEYSLDVPAGNYLVEFFANNSADPTGHGEGESFVGSQQITSNGAAGQFTATLATYGLNLVTATVTRLSTGGPTTYQSTSEFSNDVAVASSSDVAIAMTLAQQPATINTGDNLTYNITLTNFGPAPLNLDTYVGGSSLFANVLPPDVTFVSAQAQSPDIVCASLGPNSGVAIGALLANHSDYELAFCSSTGQSHVLNMGDSITVAMNTVVTSLHHSSFRSFALTSPLSGDIDNATFSTAYNQGTDLFDNPLIQQTNNFASVLYTVAQTAPAQHSAATPLKHTPLALTGQDYRRMLLASGILVTVLLSLWLYVYLRRRYKPSSKAHFSLILCLVVTAAVLTRLNQKLFAAPPPAVVINDLMYHPASQNEDDEYLELYNTTGQTVDLNGWCFTKGIDLCFGVGKTIAANSYVVISPNSAEFQAHYGFAPFDVYSGHLDNAGEKITLKDNFAATINSLTYSDHAPWATSPDGTGPSLELKDPTLDNTLASSWGASTSLTPGSVNSTYNSGLANLGSVTKPTNVSASTSPIVTALATNATSVSLVYRVNYGSEQIVTMFDDGAHGDGAPNDSVYGAAIPAQAVQQLIRYKVTATNPVGTATQPSADDTMHYFGYVVADPSLTSQIPILQWYIDPAQYSDMVNNHAFDNQEFNCVIVYGNTVFDNSQVRVKGFSTRVDFKKGFNFDLPQGYKLNIPGSTERPVTGFDVNADNVEGSSAFVPIAWQIARDMGMQTPSVFKTRIHQNGSFYGLYTFAENYDKNWRQQLGYQNDGFVKDGNSQTSVDESQNEFSDLINSVSTFRSETRRNTTLAREDVPSMINLMAFETLIHGWDWGWNKNMVAYNDPTTTNRWSVLPWDLDGSMSTNDQFFPYASPYDKVSFGISEWPGGGRPPLTNLYDEQDLRQMYFRRMRTVVDKWFGSGLLLSTFRTEVAKILPERQLDYETWPDKAAPAQAQAQTEALIQYMTSTFLVRYQLPWAVPAAQSAHPVVQFDTVSTGPTDADMYVRLKNPSNESVDISGWSIPGLNYTLHGGSIILPGEQIYLTRHDKEFTDSHTGAIVVGNFTQDLSNVTNQTLTLLRGDSSQSDTIHY